MKLARIDFDMGAPLAAIDEPVQRVQDGTIIGYRYDSAQARLVRELRRESYREPCQPMMALKAETKSGRPVRRSIGWRRANQRPTQTTLFSIGSTSNSISNTRRLKQRSC